MKRIVVFGMLGAAVGFAQPGSPIPGMEPAQGRGAIVVPRAQQAPAGRGTPAPGGRGAASPSTGATALPKSSAAVSGFSPRDLKYPAPRAVQPPKLVTATLSNGMKVYLAEEHEQPVLGGVEVKQVAIPQGEETYILCRTAGRKEKEKAIRNRFSTRMEDALNGWPRRSRRAG